MSRTAVLTDGQWARIQALLPSSVGRGLRPYRDDRRVVEGIIYRYRCGIAWRDVPAEFGPWQTIWKRHRRYSGDGTGDRILAGLVTVADARGEVGWSNSVDVTVNRPQHGTNLPHRGSSNDMNSFDAPDDDAVGRSRGGLSTKSTPSSTAKAGHWCCWSPPDRAAMRQCSLT
ncbi:transposase [Paenarthrobacter aromaticivorans]|uniref:Transposase n=1 Tax=Paenarthrobacter aromaticivorans TaxID=2849150 RepID=A0ABS6I1L5_9MICC|nr:transposase [Paenarthrobacter sp. MMS21-TAE1-1]MBU8865625.1 transposase [Paenarthrobacter sp. MMS21-TAE1-1]